jgi:hypothetical protein
MYIFEHFARGPDAALYYLEPARYTALRGGLNTLSKTNPKISLLSSFLSNAYLKPSKYPFTISHQRLRIGPRPFARNQSMALQAPTRFMGSV